MDGVRTDGHRRIDRVLGPTYLAGLDGLPIDEVRSLRDEAAQEETDLSYLRRLLQGRLDLIRDEQQRRAAGVPVTHDDAAFVAHLASVLADGERPPAQGLGRFSPPEPTRVGETRREGERIASDGLLADLTEATDEALTRGAAEVSEEEHGISEQRAAVQHVLDQLTAEIGRRYRDHEVEPETVLHDAEQHH